MAPEEQFPEVEEEIPPPHVLVFPMPIQGHLTPMLKLAELLALSGLIVTFIVTDYNHKRLLRFAGVMDRLARLPGLRLLSIPDGLPDELPRTAERVPEIVKSVGATSRPLIREVVASGSPAVTCIVADGILEFMLDLAEEIGLPIIAFRTSSACSFWAYFCIPNLVDAGDIPFTDSDMDRVTRVVPGMESFLRLRDLPSYCRAKDVNDLALETVRNATLSTTRARGLIFNTLDTIEPNALTQIRLHCPNIYTIGPLHILHSNQSCQANGYNNIASSSNSTSLWQEDISCMAWLDRQPHKSVVFVSLGSVAIPSRRQLLEIWHGLVSSGHRFLWAIRPDLMVDDGNAENTIPKEVAEGTKERGYVVGWAPQQDVLLHPAVAVFLTHSGWNSTLESMQAAVPMLCWPFFVDQMINSRFVDKVWGIGLDMKDTCERSVVEKMVRELMGEGGARGDEIRRYARKMAEVVRECVREGGSSRGNLQRLIQDIRTMSSEVITKRINTPENFEPMEEHNSSK